MTQETAELSTFVEVFDVRVQVRNVHEINSLETKMRRYGFIKVMHYENGVDDWNRPTIIRASYIVLVRRDKVMPFKTMLSKQSLRMKSSIFYRTLTSSL